MKKNLLLNTGITLALLLGTLCISPHASADNTLWQEYKGRFLATDGRVIDTGNGNISHSEGQGYALLLAVANDDRASFDRIWNWTRKHLAVREDGLFAWKWDPNQVTPITDKSNASDGDLLIAWAMARAAERWNEAEFAKIGKQLGRSIRANVVTDFAGETILLPGWQWPLRPKSAVLNLSYWIFPALQDLARLDPDPRWEKLLQSGLTLMEKSRFGTWELPSDWMILQENGRLSQAEDFPFVFGYGAVRVPLYYVWGGYKRKDLLRTYQAFWAATAQGTQLVTMIGLATNKIHQQENVLAFRVAQGLVECALTDRPAAVLASGFAAHDDYYSATFLLLAQQAAAERMPHCLPQAGQGKTAVCLEGEKTEGGRRCPLSNPIRERISAEPPTLRVVDQAQLPSSATRRPLARIAALVASPKNEERIFAVDLSGRVHTLTRGRLAARPLLDLNNLLGSALVSGSGRQGLVALAFAPAASGVPGGRLYTVHSERGLGTLTGRPIAPFVGTPPTIADHTDIITEWQYDEGEIPTVRAGSGREILRVAFGDADSGIRDIAFATDDHHALLVAVSDDGLGKTILAAAGSQAAQRLDNPYGKILRILPEAARNTAGYKVPDNNPFVARAGALKEIWAYGLRDPRLVVVMGTAGGAALLITDSGTQIQEINLGRSAANYGWSRREGTFLRDPGNPESVYALPDVAQEKEGLSYPLVQYDRDEGSTICGGVAINPGTIAPLPPGWLFCDFNQGRLFMLPATATQTSTPPALKELRLLYNGLERSLLDILSRDTQADLVVGRDGKGNLYFVSGRDGIVRRLMQDNEQGQLR